MGAILTWGQVDPAEPAYLLGQFLALLSGHWLLLHVVELGDGLGVIPEVNLERTHVAQVTLLILNHHRVLLPRGFALQVPYVHLDSV